MSVRQVQLFDHSFKAFEQFLIVGIDGLNRDRLALHLIHGVSDVFKELVVLVKSGERDKCGFVKGNVWDFR